MINYFIMPGIKNTKAVQAEVLFQEIEKFTGITKEELQSKTRLREVVDARIMYAYIMKSKTLLTLMKIGQQINRDHSCVIHYLRQFKNLQKTDKQFNLTYLKILNNL